MKAKILFIITACFMVSCDKNTDSNNNYAVRSDKYIVDYSLSSSETDTRALSASERISSLDYFVYDVDNDILVKQRRIPDISSSTVWPLTRETMTWAQRQALQDTLSRGVNYKVLFIANAAKSLFGSTQTDLLKHTEKLSTVRIILPDTPFSDNNMYYFWSKELNIAEHSTLMENVLLQRIVTRTDVSRVDIPDANVHLYSALESSLYNELTQRANGTNAEGSVRAAIKSHLTSFSDIMNTAVAGGVLTAFTVQVALLNAVIRNNDDNIDRLVASLKDKLIVDRFSTAIMNGNLYEQQIKNWNLGAGKKVEVQYGSALRANAIGFDLRTYNDSEVSNVAVCTANNGTFSIIGFAGESLNEVSSLRFFDVNINPELVIEGAFNTKQGINSLVNVQCNPTASITTIGNHTTKEMFYINIAELLGNDIFNNEAFMNALIDVVFNPAVNKQFGDSFMNFKFEIELPDLATDVDNRIKITPSWSIE